MHARSLRTWNSSDIEVLWVLIAIVLKGRVATSSDKSGRCVVVYSFSCRSALSAWTVLTPEDLMYEAGMLSVRSVSQSGMKWEIVNLHGRGA